MQTKQPIGSSTTSIAVRPNGGWGVRYRPDQRRQALIYVAAAHERGKITRAECEALVSDIWRNTWNPFDGPIEPLH